jgi:flagellar hook-associated protein 1 FlgK
LLEGFQAERQRISGVNLDEELANMILFQRVYDANARLFSTFDQMAQEILRII